MKLEDINGKEIEIPKNANFMSYNKATEPINCARCGRVINKEDARASSFLYIDDYPDSGAAAICGECACDERRSALGGD